MKFKILSNIIGIVCYSIIILTMNSMGYTILAWQTGLFLILLFIMSLNGAIWMGQHVINEIEKLSEEDLNEL